MPASACWRRGNTTSAIFSSAELSVVDLPVEICNHVLIAEKKFCTLLQFLLGLDQLTFGRLLVDL